eukprot:SAG22_NODE_11428_length_485_cov_1.595855_1_plen_40_part_10
MPPYCSGHAAMHLTGAGEATDAAAGLKALAVELADNFAKL